MTTSSLQGKKIVVTRPRDQAQPLIEQIQHAGGQAIALPLLEIQPISPSVELQPSLQTLNDCQLAIFISPNAVQFGLQAIQQHPLPEQIVAVGQGTANALAQHGIDRPLTPEQQHDSEGLLHLPQLQQVADKKIVIFRGKGGREQLADTLKARGAVVEYIECYQRILAPIDIPQLLQQQPDAIILSSSEAARHLASCIQQAKQTALFQCPIFSIHPRISEQAARHWQKTISCTNTPTELVLCISEYFNR